MTDAEFRHYIIEQRLQGRSDSQIARSLGMSLRHMIGKLNGVNVDKIDPPKPKAESPKQEKKAEVKPVSGAKQPEKHEKAKKEKKGELPKAEEPQEKEKEKAEDLSWME